MTSKFQKQLAEMTLTNLAAEAKKAGVTGYSKVTNAKRDECIEAILNAMSAASKRVVEKASAKPAKQDVEAKGVEMPTVRKLANTISRLGQNERANLRNEFASELPKHTKSGKVFTAIAKAR